MFIEIEYPHYRRDEDEEEITFDHSIIHKVNLNTRFVSMIEAAKARDNVWVLSIHMNGLSEPINIPFDNEEYPTKIVERVVSVDAEVVEDLGGM